jgi:histidine triad (HIT) family protein
MPLGSRGPNHDITHRSGYRRIVADCIFCSIASGEIPADVVLTSSNTVAFRDMSPKAPVHVLVVPKQHYSDVPAVAAADPALVAEILTTAAAVAGQEGVADDGYRIIANTGSGAGQTVFHAHVHVLAGGLLPGF